ncbi:hypothetical protein B6U96_12580 [Archaeoglobales archaeon ex4484_92]|nr:MAG: hypothetical protein B6U96_12580 [Archaeoglobales archaeon ex4484_92]
MTVIWNDCHRIEKEVFVFRGLRIRITGEIRWRGKQDRLEIHYDDLTGRWYALQSAEVSANRVISNKRAELFTS